MELTAQINEENYQQDLHAQYEDAVEDKDYSSASYYLSLLASRGQDVSNERTRLAESIQAQIEEDKVQKKHG